MYYPSACLEGLRKTIKNFSHALEKKIKDEKTCRHLLDDLKKNKSYWNPQDEALDGTPQLTCFGKINAWKKFISFTSIH